jgi:hypothetical protein
MSALPPKADIAKRAGNVRFVPKADITNMKASQTAKPSVDEARGRDGTISTWSDSNGAL